MAPKKATRWINVDGLGDSATRQEIGAAFGLHPLALEDIVNLHQRPKVEAYDVYFSLSCVCPSPWSQRRALWPRRDMLNVLLRKDSPLIEPHTRIYLRDCQDHAIQLIDMTETYREICSGLVDIHLSTVSNRMNEVMKVLTIIATIFIPLTLIVGLYGMNFDPDAGALSMPELRWRYGYPVILVLMAIIAAGQVFWFRRKGWIGKVRD